MNNLQTCDWQHPAIAFTTKYCPLCETKRIIDELEVEVKSLNKKIKKDE